MKFTEQQERLIFVVLDEILRKPYDEINTTFGTRTIAEMKDLHDRMKYDDYCKRNGVKYENLTDDDREMFALEMIEKAGG